MALPLYLAMTAAEMGGSGPIPDKFAYMACHFSPYGTGLSNLPAELPPGGMLILNDRIPPRGHDDQLITNQLTELIAKWQCGCLLLDFQQPYSEETAALVRMLPQALPCPVAVSESYAGESGCPVFLPPAPPDVPIGQYLRPWEGREIWLEAALDGLELTLTEAGCDAVPLPCPGLKEGTQDTSLHCHYQISADTDAARFTLFRTQEDLNALLEEAESLGITRAVGLWQELHRL